MGINPNSAFVRIYFDLPTQDAIKFDEIAKASGKTKKAYLAELVTSEIARKGTTAKVKKS